jgi:putative protease
VSALQPRIERGPGARSIRARRSRACAALVCRIEFWRSTARPGAPRRSCRSCESDAQLDAVIAAGCARGRARLDGVRRPRRRAVERARDAGLVVHVATTRIGKPGEEALLDRIRKLAPDGVLVRHFGALMRCLAFRAAGRPTALHGDFSLNVTNSLTARHLLARSASTP